ncbi:ATP synthase F1 subunit epsilon [Coprobacter tertius]|uniref:ATP synthase F1 subunit epsilon n=1 Tax=Coprobacter tertius TaxID=2944915 RepID=A0ABT1MFW5_9BACT|nr:ATP synthase F1 subunit epsilon [Coprobacter tertius]MCP9611538.1 ATP synthase F1 subunit epsilon [Coprobacter tertius]
MDLEIISSEKVLFRGKVRRVTLPGTMGSFTVLEDHASLLSTLTPGVIEYEAEGEVKTVPIDGGFVDVNNNRVAVCLQ